MIQLRGMTWDHRRAVDPLLAATRSFAEVRPDIHIDWDRRSLHGFEYQSVPELAKAYDFIILDHPFCGLIAATGCLLPQDELAGSAASFVGPSLRSYDYAGHIWALPVDAASQVAVSRPDLMASLGTSAPRNWDDVLKLGEVAEARGLRLAIGLKGVHSLMTFFFLCANLGAPCATDPAETFVDRTAGRQALAAIRALLRFCPPQCLGWSSIALHDAMQAGDDLAYCPVVYCYATYAERDHQRPLAFHDLPGLRGEDPRGSAIGGTGLGISARCREPEAARAFAAHLAGAGVQTDFAAHHGQPARVEAWDDPAVDARFGGVFSAVRLSIEKAWVRPRYDGYLTVQAMGGDLVEAHLRGDLAERDLFDRLDALHRAAGGRAA